MIRFDDVGKDFGGALARARGRAVRALDGISLELAPGAALGLAGPNGAGKSTLIKLLLGYRRPTRGEVTVGGMAPREYAETHGIAYVSEQVAIPPDWSVDDALRAFAALAEIDQERERIERMLEQLGIAGMRQREVGALSKGNLQRLGLAQALLAPRKLMILDEPTQGLDPDWTARLRGLVADWRAADPERVLVVASHNLDEMERMVDRVAVLRDGRLRAVLDARGPRQTVIEADPVTAAGLPGAIPGLIPDGRVPGTFTVSPRDPVELSRQLGNALRGGLVLHELSTRPEPLEARVRAALLRGGEA